MNYSNAGRGGGQRFGGRGGGGQGFGGRGGGGQGFGGRGGGGQGFGGRGGGGQGFGGRGGYSQGFGGRGGGGQGFGGRGGGGAGNYGSNGNFRGGRGTGRGMKRSFGEGRGGFDNKRARFQADLNPENLIPVAKVSHISENKVVCKVSLEDQVPMFNQPVFLENKTHIGKSDEIFGQLNSVLMSVELVETIKSESLDKKQLIYMDPSKVLPKDRFLPKDPPDPLAPKIKRKGTVRAKSTRYMSSHRSR